MLFPCGLNRCDTKIFAPPFLCPLPALILLLPFQLSVIVHKNIVWCLRITKLELMQVLLKTDQCTWYRINYVLLTIVRYQICQNIFSFFPSRVIFMRSHFSLSHLVIWFFLNVCFIMYWFIEHVFDYHETHYKNEMYYYFLTQWINSMQNYYNQCSGKPFTTLLRTSGSHITTLCSPLICNIAKEVCDPSVCERGGSCCYGF